MCLEYILFLLCPNDPITVTQQKCHHASWSKEIKLSVLCNPQRQISASRFCLGPPSSCKMEELHRRGLLALVVSGSLCREATWRTEMAHFLEDSEESEDHRRPLAVSFEAGDLWGHLSQWDLPQSHFASQRFLVMFAREAKALHGPLSLSLQTVTWPLKVTEVSQKAHG